MTSLPAMDEKRIQHLTEAFASIISMMLGMLRVHGWRCLLHLPEIWLTARYLRRLGEQFAALMADFKAGRLVLPTPAPWTAPPDQEAAYTDSPTPLHLAARPAPAARDRQRPVARRSPTAAAVEPDRPRATSCAVALPNAHGQAMLRPFPSRFGILILPAGAIATGRSC
jgi:hypothetical protein